MKITPLIFFLLAGILSVSCDEEGDAINEDFAFWEDALLRGPGCVLTDADAREEAASIVPGFILSSADLAIDGDIVYYNLVMQDPSSTASVVIDLNQEPCALYRIQGLVGPFTYELVPPLQLLSFSNARSKALSAQNGSILNWFLLRNPAFEGDWIYTFDILTDNGNTVIINVNAKDGSLI